MVDEHRKKLYVEEIQVGKFNFPMNLRNEKN